MRGGDPGLVYSQDSRLPAAQAVRGHGGPVLGPTLGGGFSGSGIGSGVGRVGGGSDQAVTHAQGGDLIDYPAARVDVHFDYTTPKLIFERLPARQKPLPRGLGGLE